jgi:hypothetical protein
MDRNLVDSRIQITIARYEYNFHVGFIEMKTSFEEGTTMQLRSIAGRIPAVINLLPATSSSCSFVLRSSRIFSMLHLGVWHQK